MDRFGYIYGVYIFLCIEYGFYTHGIVFIFLCFYGLCMVFIFFMFLMVVCMFLYFYVYGWCSGMFLFFCV